MKIVQCFVFLLITYLKSNLACAHGAYAPYHHTNDIEESLKDESLVKLGYSNPVYDNVGMLCYSNVPGSKPMSLASAVYIGDRFCLTSAHTYVKDINYSVYFEINGEKTSYYRILDFIIHPNYKENNLFDIAILVLNEPVDGLNGLRPCYEFSKENCNFNDYEHLLTYVGYGAKFICNDWFFFSDQKRRATQGYTYGCYTNPEKLGILSMPYRKINTLKRDRSPILYEEKGRHGMSGGAVIHPELGLVSIFLGSKDLEDGYSFFNFIFYVIFQPISSAILYGINIIVLQPIEYYLFPVIYFEYCFFSDTHVMYSTPLGPVKDWIEGTKTNYEV